MSSSNYPIRLIQLSDRIKSFIIDNFFISTPILYITFYLILGDGETFQENRLYGWSVLIVLHMTAVLLFWLIKGQTPGLKAYEAQLVQTNNTTISVFQAILRYILTLFTIITIIPWVIPFLRKDQKTLQDLLTKTHIIYKKNASS